VTSELDPATTFAVVDVETSGLSPRRHRVLQIGVVVVDAHGVVLRRWSTLVRPRRWWPRVGPTHIHGITRRDLRAATTTRDALERFRQVAGDSVIVAHNAEFDLAFLRAAARRSGVDLEFHTTLCTLRASRALDPGRARSHRLAALCERYGIELVTPHDALADAAATAAVLPKLLAEHGIDVDAPPPEVLGAIAAAALFDQSAA
jgi:DNA polymerase III epsilon subunit family exonuclease